MCDFLVDEISVRGGEFMSLTDLIVKVLGIVCLVAGVLRLVQGPLDIINIAVALLLLVIGYVLVTGKGFTL